MKNVIGEKTTINIIKYLVSAMVVMMIGAIIIKLQGGDPLMAFVAIIKGSVGDFNAIGQTIRWATPCIITGIAAVIAFKSGIWNVGIEGQMYVGAFVAAIIGYEFIMPKGLHIFVTLVAAGIMGLVYALIPAILKMYLDVNELISTLMLNYVAVLFTEYLTFKYMGFDASELADAIATPEVQPTVQLSTIIPGTNASTAIFIALAVAILIYMFYKYTIKGYELKQVGKNLKFTKFGGVKTKATFLMIFLLSGFIAGLCGGTEVLGPLRRFRTSFAINLGWDGVMIASISKDSPIGVMFISLIWGALKSGSFAMERMTSTNRLVISVLQALFVLLVAIDYEAIYMKIKEHNQIKKINNQGIEV